MSGDTMSNNKDLNPNLKKLLHGVGYFEDQALCMGTEMLTGQAFPNQKENPEKDTVGQGPCNDTGVC